MASAPRRAPAALAVLQWLPEYQLRSLRPDLVAGLTLAAYLLPAGIGDASLAGLPAEAGLYACLFSGLVFWLFCSSRQTVVTVTSALSLLIGASVGDSSGGDPARHAAMAACVTVLVAVIACLAWLVRAGNAVGFFSETVLVGFKAGLALYLASTQFPKLLGLLRQAARPRVTELARVPGTTLFADRSRHPENERMPGVLVIRCESALLYFNVEFVRERVFELLSARTDVVRLVVFFLGAVPKIDLAGAELLADLGRTFNARGLELRLADAHGEVRDALRRIGFEREYGPLLPGQSVDRVVSEWQASAGAARGTA
jgi:MFS superfamily sulfate permease-like transporter